MTAAIALSVGSLVLRNSLSGSHPQHRRGCRHHIPFRRCLLAPPAAHPLCASFPSPLGSSAHTSKQAGAVSSSTPAARRASLPLDGWQQADGSQLSCHVPEAAEGDMAAPENMHKWRMVIAYDGTKFKGWQYQPSSPTIQCFLENALICITKLDRKKLCLIGAGRTDTGVHAWGQVAHFTTPFAYDCLDDVHSAINGLLPPEIRVREISAARPEFHACTSTKTKIYQYKIYNEAIMDPFHNCYAYHSSYKLNPHAMREAANYFVGMYDFTSFANAAHNDRERSPIKKIARFDVTEMGAVLQLEVEGTGFLYRQVRNMVKLISCVNAYIQA